MLSEDNKAYLRELNSHSNGGVDSCLDIYEYQVQYNSCMKYRLNPYMNGDVKIKYSRPSVARILMAHLPRLLQTCS